jgi:hypothetical protein
MSFQAMLSKLKQDVSAPLPSSSAPSTAAAAAVEPPKKRQKTVNNNGDHDTSAKSDHFPFPKNKVKTIYLACPPNVQTGGPEAMHQLCHKINSLSNDVSASDSANTNDGSGTGTGIRLSAYMLFLKEQPHQEDQYIQHVTNAKILYAYESMYDNLKTASSFPMMMEEDGDDLYSDSLIIWPECWTHLIDSFQPENYTDSIRNNNSNKRYQTAIWWLSVNNNNSKFKEWDREDILHLYQSEYAKCYLVDNILKNKPKSTINDSSTNTSTNTSPVSYHNILPMTEFIPNRDDNNNNNSNNTSSKTRNLQIVYNPFKGVHYTDSIIRRSDTKFKFTPIGSTQKRISPSDVTKLLNAAKVYIDFGPHPGMDRLPREAALAGCIVITNKEGAAYYHEDVPLPKEYKVEKFDVDHIHRLLSSSIDQYDDKRKEFDSYRDWIHGQEGRMDICVKDFLKQISVDRKG